MSNNVTPQISWSDRMASVFSHLIHIRSFNAIFTGLVLGLIVVNVMLYTNIGNNLVNPRNSYAAAWTNCDTQTQIPAIQCQALIALYTSTNGPSRSINTDRLQTDTPCSRYGVICQGGNVTNLQLYNNQLSGPIPSTLGNLSNLTQLQLYNNQLSGPIPSTLGNLSNLTQLQLYNNQLSGSIPAFLNNITSSEYLYINGSNHICGIIPAGVYPDDVPPFDAPLCINGYYCNVNADCQSNICSTGVCVASSSTTIPSTGFCGTASGVVYPYSASSFGSDTFCSAGTQSPSILTFPSAGSSVEWSCQGSNSGTNAFCSASHASSTTIPSTGFCGTASGVVYPYSASGFGSDTFCSAGTQSPSILTFPSAGSSVEWSCQGSNSGTNAFCSASHLSLCISRQNIYSYTTVPQVSGVLLTQRDIIIQKDSSVQQAKKAYSRTKTQICSCVAPMVASGDVCLNPCLNNQLTLDEKGSSLCACQSPMLLSGNVCVLPPLPPCSNNQIIINNNIAQCVCINGMTSSNNICSNPPVSSSSSNGGGAYNPICYPTVDDANCDGNSDTTTTIPTIPIIPVAPVISETLLPAIKNIDAEIRHAQAQKYKYQRMGNLGYVLPDKLYPTGTPRQLIQAIGITPQIKSDLDMETPPWVVMNDVTNNQTIDLSYRLAKLPAEVNHDAESYLVVPRLGVVTPIQTPTADYDPDNYTAIKSGLMPKGIHKRYLKDGILRMPDGPNGGELGNIVLFGHSSFVRKYSGHFNTVFATIPLLQAGDKVYLYEKGGGENNYIMYEYRVITTNEVAPEETSVMLPGMGANMTLITCTPHGTVRNRRVVKLKLAEEVDHQASYIKLAQQIDTTKRASIQRYLSDIDSNDMSQKGKNLELQELWSKLNTLEQSSDQAQAALLIDYTRSEIVDLYDGGRNPRNL